MNDSTRELLARLNGWLDSLPDTAGVSIYRGHFITFVQLQMNSDDAVLELAAALGLEDVSVRPLTDGTYAVRASSRVRWDVRIDVAGPVHGAALARRGGHEPWS